MKTDDSEDEADGDADDGDGGAGVGSAFMDVFKNVRIRCLLFNWSMQAVEMVR